MDALLVVTALAYLASGLVGWCIGIVARFSKRYYPALSFTGMAIGLLPTYSLTVLVLRWRGLVVDDVDLWQRVTIMLVCVTIVALGVAALVYAARAVVEERAARRAWR